jgi:hypothetical protein
MIRIEQRQGSFSAASVETHHGAPMLINKFLAIALAAACLPLFAPSASAQAPRTWVSGVGDDANPCSRTAPCKTFAGAISKTVAGGEISVLDPGGYGALTITKAITIDGGGGQVASVLVQGTNGIVIQAGANDSVTLRNLRFDGMSSATGVAGTNAIQFLSGAALHVENCTIFNFAQNGININVSSGSTTSVFVTDTVVTRSVNGIAARTTGSGSVLVSMQRTTLAQNTSNGLKVDGGGGAGALFASLSDSLVAGNGAGVSAVSGAANAQIDLTRVALVNNIQQGALSNASAGHSATVNFSFVTISGNGTGMSSVGGGNLRSFSSNTNVGNQNSNGAFTNTQPPT